MTRKDYVMLEAALKSARMQHPTDAQIVQHRFCVSRVADALAADNPRFDRARFLRESGVAS